MGWDDTKNILVSGVGGQGILLASELIAKAAMFDGFDVKKSEVHGLSQRGGSVESHVRIGKRVFSPIIPKGEADLILAFERAEALRWIHYLKEKSGIVVVNDVELIPVQVTLGLAQYPSDIAEKLREVAREVYFINAYEEAQKLGNSRVFNTYLVGVLSSFFEISENSWLRAIEATVPKNTIEINKRAFLEGRNWASTR